VKGAVFQRGSKWHYKFRGPERDPSTGEYPWITKGGFPTKKDAWQACREAMAEADRGRVVRPSTRSVAQFFAEWFAAIEPSIDATTWQNWKDYAAAYVIPRIGGERLQRLDEPQLLKLYGQLLAEGRIKPDRNGEMYAYWSDRVANGETPTAREVSEACNDPRSTSSRSTVQIRHHSKEDSDLIDELSRTVREATSFADHIAQLAWDAFMPKPRRSLPTRCRGFDCSGRWAISVICEYSTSRVLCAPT
jgi:Arm DNA-binding domain